MMLKELNNSVKNKEDQTIQRLFRKNQSLNQKEKLIWEDIAKIMNQELRTSKSGKQCRQRWLNQISQEVSRQVLWTQEQIRVLFSKQSQWGNKWAEISKLLPGRTDNSIKNYFHSTLRKAMNIVKEYAKKGNISPRLKLFERQNLKHIINQSNTLRIQEEQKEKICLAKKIILHLKQLILCIYNGDENDESKERIAIELLQYRKMSGKNQRISNVKNEQQLKNTNGQNELKSKRIQDNQEMIIDYYPSKEKLENTNQMQEQFTINDQANEQDISNIQEVSQFDKSLISSSFEQKILKEEAQEITFSLSQFFSEPQGTSFLNKELFDDLQISQE